MDRPMATPGRLSSRGCSGVSGPVLVEPSSHVQSGFTDVDARASETSELEGVAVVRARRDRSHPERAV